MPKRATRRTQHWVNNVRPPRRGVKWHFLGTVPGLALRVSASCAKDFYLWFRVPDPKKPGKTKSTPRKLGEHPDMTLKDAEDKAIKARESRDPRAFFGGPGGAGASVEALAEEYVAKRLSGLRSGKRSEDRLQRHVLDAPCLIGKKAGVWREQVPVALTWLDMTTVTDRIKEENGPVESLATYQVIQAMMRWGVKKGHITRNPFEGYEPPAKQGERDRVLSDNELRRLWLVTPKLSDAVSRLVRVLVLTGLRRGEAATLHDDEVRDHGIVVTTDIMKKDVAHFVPITPMLRAELEPVLGQGYLVSASGGRTPFKGFSRAKETIDKHLTLDEPWELHDLRRTVRTGLGRLGVSRDIARRCTSHAVGNKIDRIYDRYKYEPEVVEAMELWAGHVRDLVTPPPDNVERLPTPKLSTG